MDCIALFTVALVSVFDLEIGLIILLLVAFSHSHTFCATFPFAYWAAFIPLCAHRMSAGTPLSNIGPHIAPNAAQVAPAVHISDIVASLPFSIIGVSAPNPHHRILPLHMEAHKPVHFGNTLPTHGIADVTASCPNTSPALAALEPLVNSFIAPSVSRE